MKPHLICHMLSSVDGRILGSRWRPQGVKTAELFERLHDQLEGDGWIVGRVTGQEFSRREAYPATTDQTFSRKNHLVSRDAASYGIVLDAHGKIAWGRTDIGGDPIVVLLTRAVSDAHLAGLREDGVSYIFAGEREIDLAAALETLSAELGRKRLLVEGGGGANGAFLRAGLIDEVSLVVCPTVDGAKGAPSVFDSSEADAGQPAEIDAMELVSSEVLDGGAVWLRYRLS